MTNTINEVKRRKDIVNKYVENKEGKNIIHGIQKKFNRKTQLLKQVTRITTTKITDSEYNELAEKFFNTEKQLNLLIIEIQAWTKTLCEFSENSSKHGSLIQEIFLNIEKQNIENNNEDKSNIKSFISYYNTFNQFLCNFSNEEIINNAVIFLNKFIFYLF